MTKNIYLRRDGRFEGRIYFDKSEDGNRKYKAFFGHSREEVEQKMAAYRQANVRMIHTEQTFSDISSNWISSIQH